jgi:predicted O-linked N-acetylglucosamine transferase (SPINDLY family)
MVEAHFSLGVALHALCRSAEAVECYRHALAINPGLHKTFDNYVMTQQFVPEIDADALFAAHLAYAAQFETPLKPSWPKHRNVRDPERRLKVGYVSGDFRSHAVAYFIEPILAWHDRERVEVFCYANQKKDDAVTARLRGLSDHWRSCIAQDDDELAQQIQEDGIDILIDLSGHTSHNRLLTFARKPAPLQITYVGYLSTSGLSAMDYRLTDRLAEPPGSERYYSEQLLYLPDSMWCFQAPIESPEITPLPALANGYLTFGSFNNVDKVNKASIELWSALLRKLPDARMVMLARPDVQPHFLRLFAQGGIAASRLTFIGKAPPHEYRKTLQSVDIALDSYPVNGATTTCECLWQGLPVLSLAGPRFLSRNGMSILRAAQLPDFAAQSESDLINTASLLADNPALLNGIRMGMREHLSKTALMDGQRFTANLEAIYRDIWHRWCAAS